MSMAQICNWSIPNDLLRRVILLLSMGCLSIALWGKSEIPQGADVDAVLIKSSKVGDHDSSSAGFKDLHYFNQTDLTQASKLLQQLQDQRTRYISKLKQDYGDDTYLNLFEPLKSSLRKSTQPDLQGVRESIGRSHIFKAPSALSVDKKFQKFRLNRTKFPEKDGWDRLVRKMSLKLLQVQLGILEERLGCQEECAQIKNMSRSPGVYTEFNWITGGHSAAAGHGNFYRESYTATLERAVKPVLTGIGINFNARSYAMGGYSSAPELSLCSTAVFGRDADIVSWDYGMTDGELTWKLAFYALRMAKLSECKDCLSQPGNVPYRPALFGIHQDGKHNLVMSGLQELGMTVLGLDSKVLGFAKGRLPSIAGKTQEEIEALPPFVKYFKCSKGVENGKAGCGEHKFNNSICSDRPYKTGWHPGWKYHGLVGNLIGVSLLDAFEDAAKKLVRLEPGEKETASERYGRLTSQLQKLSDEEGEDYRRLLKTPFDVNKMNVKSLASGYFNLLKKTPVFSDEDVKKYEKIFKEKHPHVHWLPELQALGLRFFEMLKESPSFCHTALLPAETRIKGLLTGDGVVADGVLDQSTYDIGTNKSWIISHQKNFTYDDPRDEYAGKMLLVRDDGARHTCPEPLHFDYRDFFQVSSGGWKKLVFPNDKEAEYYSDFDLGKSKGIIILCLNRCKWGKCEKGDVSFKMFKEEEVAKFGSIDFTINGVEATKDLRLDSNCKILRHSSKNSTDFPHVWQPNKDGKYEIQMRLTTKSSFSFVRMSSFILL